MKTSTDVYFVEAFNPSLDALGQQLDDVGIHSLASVVAFSVSEKPDLFEGGRHKDSYVSPQFKVLPDQRYLAIRLATQTMPYP